MLGAILAAGAVLAFLTVGLASSSADVACPNEAIREGQGPEVLALPECLALEQVSPSKKANQAARLKPNFGSSVSADGSGVLFNSVATLGTCPNVNGISGDVFIARRSQATGWATECTNPPVDRGSGFPAFSFTPDLSDWFQVITVKAGGLEFVRGIGNFGSLSPPLTNLTSPGGPSFVGASADHSRLYFIPEGNQPRNGTFLAGDPLPEGVGEDANLYLAHLDSTGQPAMELAARDSDGKVWGGNCGARLGGMEAAGNNFNLRNGFRNQGAISTDGTRVYFSTRPDQPASGNCTEIVKKRILERRETSTEVDISELFQSECDRVAPACSTVDGDDVYQGASIDQSRVYFTTTRQLADTDLDGSANSCDLDVAVVGCDLYLYDADQPLGQRLIQVSAGGASAASQGSGAAVRNSVTAISADGSHVYFVAKTVLTTDPNPVGNVAEGGKDNLYLYVYPEGELRFVGTLEPGDGGSLFGGAANWENQAYAVPITKAGVEGGQAGGDGHILLFGSGAPLTADDGDGARDIFRYDADAGTLQRISKAEPGGSDSGPFGTTIPPQATRPAGTDYAEKARWVSEDGETVVFTTAEALLQGDANGVEDSYLWRQGQLFRLPGSKLSSPKATQILPVLSHDGSTIAYHSTQRLVPADGDSVEDVYVLRPGGGFPTLVPSFCEGEACQGPPAPPPGAIGEVTQFPPNPGNVKPAKPPCLKGKRKVRRGGKVRCVKPKHGKQSTQKRAGARRGGQK